MTDDDLDRHLRGILFSAGMHYPESLALSLARSRLRLAVDAARREGAEEMRERCAKVADACVFEGDPSELMEGPRARNYVSRRIAAAIRALPGASS